MKKIFDRIAYNVGFAVGYTHAFMLSMPTGLRNGIEIGRNFGK